LAILGDILVVGLADPLFKSRSAEPSAEKGLAILVAGLAEALFEIPSAEPSSEKLLPLLESGDACSFSISPASSASSAFPSSEVPLASTALSSGVDCVSTNLLEPLLTTAAGTEELFCPVEAPALADTNPVVTAASPSVRMVSADKVKSKFFFMVFYLSILVIR
jgi:hypothetical protein